MTGKMQTPLQVAETGGRHSGFLGQRLGKTSGELHCVVAGTVIDTKSTGTIAGDTAAHTEIHTTFSPAFGGVTESTMIQDQKYVGSCPAGAQPGDMTNADGTVIHLGKH